MDIFLRTIAIGAEAVVLAALLYCLLRAVWLIIFDLGLVPKYKRIIAIALITIGCLVAAFLIAHLSSFYPTI